MSKCKLCASVGFFLVVALHAVSSTAADVWEPGDNVWGNFSATQLIAGHPPQLHDLQGSPDVDWFTFLVRPARSYEVATYGFANISSVAFARHSDETTVLQSSSQMTSRLPSGAVFFLGARTIRWAESVSSSTMRQFIKVSWSGTPTQQYFIQFRESTLFCPRFNNSGSQVSVMIVQAALDGSDACGFTAHFFNESGVSIGSQIGSFDVTGTNLTPMAVVSLPGVSGLAGQKGSAQIAHTCGYGNLKAKLVALEPATGFSFDTPCTVREQ